MRYSIHNSNMILLIQVVLKSLLNAPIQLPKLKSITVIENPSKESPKWNTPSIFLIGINLNDYKYLVVLNL